MQGLQYLGRVIDDLANLLSVLFYILSYLQRAINYLLICCLIARYLMAYEIIAEHVSMIIL